MSRFTRAVPFSIEPRRRGYLSSPTRNRTRNFWLEARDDFRFTIEPFLNKRKERESNPQGTIKMLARLATGYRRPSDCPSVKLSGPKGNRTLLTDLARICRPLGTCQPISEVRPGIEPGLRPYHRRVLPQHLQTLSLSDRGWNRTIDLLHVTQTSSPLDHAIVF